MTPERAAELVKAALSEWNRHSSARLLSDIFEHTILQACKEQREADAKIMREAAEDVAEWGTYADAYFQEKWDLDGTIKKWLDRETAIRGAP